MPRHYDTSRACINYTYAYIVIRSVIIISIYSTSKSGSQIPEPLLLFNSNCHWKVQISQGLGPCFQLELLKTGRPAEISVSVKKHSSGD